jgi:hypothetical protein
MEGYRSRLDPLRQWTSCALLVLLNEITRLYKISTRPYNNTAGQSG